MPKSRGRKKPEVQHKEGHTPKAPDAPKPNPAWWAPTMVTLMLAGLVFIVVSYLFKGQFPLPPLAKAVNGNGNLLAGFALVITGFLMTLRWR